MKDRIIIAIAGGSASGKTYLSQKIYDYFHQSDDACIIRQDDYYKDQSHMEFEERTKTNYDHPQAFDNDLLIEQLQQLKAGQTIQKPTYDYTLHTRSSVVETVEPRPVIILEGLFVLYDEQLREQCDMLIYVDTDDDLRFIRRLKRDMVERGRSLESVCDQYLTTVKPMHEQFIEPTKKHAHFIVLGDKPIQVAVNLIVTTLKSLIKE